ncbi:MAG TPA: hypothetical protein VF263_08340 [Longimicrobiaceae bacterium]
MRFFRDDDGVEWQVWRVVPDAPLVLERRMKDRRSGLPSNYRGEERRRGARRSGSSGGLKDGWLCFQAAEGKRRLAPVPPEWESCPEPELVRMHAAASPVRMRSPAV